MDLEAIACVHSLQYSTVQYSSFCYFAYALYVGKEANAYAHSFLVCLCLHLLTYTKGTPFIRVHVNKYGVFLPVYRYPCTVLPSGNFIVRFVNLFNHSLLLIE